MAGAGVAFSCSCGQLGGVISDVSPRSGTHVECHCTDCRTAQLFLGQPDPRPGGVHIFQITPDRLTITRGIEHLGLLRLSPKGAFRWYATCCNAPLFSTAKSPKIPFLGVVAARLAEPARIGKVVTHLFQPTPDGKTRTRGAATLAWRLATQMGAAWLSGRWRQTPLFDLATGQPAAAPRVLSKAERAAAQAL